MTDEEPDTQNYSKKLFVNFKNYMHTWFPFIEEMESNIDEAIGNINNTIDSNTENINTILSQKADKNEIPVKLTDLTNDGGFLTNNDVKDTLASAETQMPLSANQGKELKAYIDNQFAGIRDMVYPIGSIYMSVNSTNPSTLFGGTWVRLKDTFLLASGDAYGADSTNATTAQHGAATVSLAKENMPRHTHVQNAHNHPNSTHRHSNPASDNNYKFLLADENIAVNGTPRGPVAETNTGDWHYVYAPTKTGLADIIEREYTAYATVTVGDKTATNKYTGGTSTTEAEQNGSAHNNMPPYLSVYMWKRTA